MRSLQSMAAPKGNQPTTCKVGELSQLCGIKKRTLRRPDRDWIIEGKASVLVKGLMEAIPLIRRSSHAPNIAPSCTKCQKTGWPSMDLSAKGKASIYTGFRMSPDDLG